MIDNIQTLRQPGQRPGFRPSPPGSLGRSSFPGSQTATKSPSSKPPAPTIPVVSTLSREERQEAKRIVEEANFNFSGYQVVRREFISHRFDPAMTIRGNSITFNNSCISKLEDATHIQFLINPTERKLAIRPCDEGARDAVRWCIVKGDKRKSREITCRPFTTKLYELMGWETIYRYKLQGMRINYNGESLYLFDLCSKEAFLPQSRDPETGKIRQPIETIDTNDYPDINFYSDSTDTDVITTTDDFPDTIEPKDTTEIEDNNIELAKEQGYDPSILAMIQKLKNAQISSKDKRLGSMLALCLLSGEITKNDYEKHGHLNRWNPDMYLASQMGIVEKVNPHKYIILHKAKEGPVTLSNAQKKMITEIYESFGEESFSTEMVVATLDYTSPHVSAYLHKFTLLKILDCWKEHVNKYQFLISPKEYPEYFIQVA